MKNIMIEKKYLRCLGVMCKGVSKIKKKWVEKKKRSVM
jgi:hypothetical protein